MNDPRQAKTNLKTEIYAFVNRCYVGDNYHDAVEDHSNITIWLRMAEKIAPDQLKTFIVQEIGESEYWNERVQSCTSDDLIVLLEILADHFNDAILADIVSHAYYYFTIHRYRGLDQSTPFWPITKNDEAFTLLNSQNPLTGHGYIFMAKENGLSSEDAYEVCLREFLQYKAYLIQHIHEFESMDDEEEQDSDDVSLNNHVNDFER